MKKIAFIGSGVMGTAMGTAACRGIDPQQVVVTDSDQEKAKSLAQALGCCYAPSNEEAVQECRYIMFCIKPQVLYPVLQDLAPVFKSCRHRGEEKIIVSIVAGVESKTYIEAMGLEDYHVPVIRMQPNTACVIGKSYTVVLDDDGYSQEQLSQLLEILRETGKFEKVAPAQYIPAMVLTTISPAFASMFASALADGGVVNGLFRPQARRHALEGVLSALQLMLESEKHLDQFKDEVCSPAGPGIYGVKSLEDSGFRGSLIRAVGSCCDRFKEIGKIG